MTNPLVDPRLHDSTLKLVIGLLAGIYGNVSEESLDQARTDIQSGLQKVGISRDRKTVKAVPAAATKALPRFLDQQAKRDD